jgi:hypothetical protein
MENRVDAQAPPSSLATNSQRCRSAKHKVGKVIIGEGISVSTQGAISYVVVPDGQGLEGAEVCRRPASVCRPRRNAGCAQAGTGS